MTKRKHHTPESLALAEKNIDALVSLFPMEDCHVMVKQALSENCTEIPEEAIEELKKFASLLLASSNVSELPQTTPEEEDAAYLEDEVYTAANNIVTSWLNALDHARGQSGDKPVRLDSSLLPPPELTKYDGIGWDEWLTNSLVLTAEQIRELMALYAVRLIVVFDAYLANKPNGVELTEDILVRRDKDGFYLPPEVKE